MECLVDQRQHAFEISIDLVIPETKDSVPLFCKMAVAFCITFCMCIKVVLATVDFDDEAMLEADKVNDETIAGRLAAKMKSALPP